MGGFRGLKWVTLEAEMGLELDAEVGAKTGAGTKPRNGRKEVLVQPDTSDGTRYTKTRFGPQGTVAWDGFTGMR